MFVFLIWNKNGKELKAMFEYKKAEEMKLALEKYDVNPHIVFERGSSQNKLITN